MLLYATTTSERAQKSQGGNEWLGVKVEDDKGTSLLLLMFTIEKEKPVLKQCFGEFRTLWSLREKLNNAIDLEIARMEGKL